MNYCVYIDGTTGITGFTNGTHFESWVVVKLDNFTICTEHMQNPMILRSSETIKPFLKKFKLDLHGKPNG